MEQTIEQGRSFLEGGTYDGADYFPATCPASGPSTLTGKRKSSPVSRYLDESSPPRRRSRGSSPATSPPRKKQKSPQKAKAPVQKKKKAPSPSPPRPKSRKKRNNTKKSKKTSDDKSNVQTLPITWEFQSEKPAFGVHAGRGKCWMGNENGDIFGFNAKGEMERHIQLPAGVKSIVSDMSMWLYAGCDNGIVYDLSHESEPREAYHFHDLHESRLWSAAQSLAWLDTHPETVALSRHGQKSTSTSTHTGEETSQRARHIVFTVDCSRSMKRHRIQEVAANLQMIYEYHLRAGDIVTLITFNSSVQVRYTRVTKGPEDGPLREYMASPALLQCDQKTAFYDALGVSYQQFAPGNEEECWVIALTDGRDNYSSRHSLQTVTQLVQEHDVNLIAIYMARRPTDVFPELQGICAGSPNGLAIYADVNDPSQGITSAFKHIAQLLSSHVMSMDIRDGLLTLSDHKGQLVACSMEGHPLWETTSPGERGWMVRSDFEGVYHGHSAGVSKYHPLDGHSLWEAELPAGVLFGWLDKTTHTLYVATELYIQAIDAHSGALVRQYECDAAVISTAASHGSDVIYCGDNQGYLYAFEKSGKRIAKVATQKGSVLSLHLADDQLFAVTSYGFLLCIPTASVISLPGCPAKPPVTRRVERPKALPVTLPSLPGSSLETVSDCTAGVLVEFRRSLPDHTLCELAAAIHGTEDHVLWGSRSFPIGRRGERRCVEEGQLLVIEQDKEASSDLADMARAGDQVTWITNGRGWALVVNGTVQWNATHLLAYPAANDQGFDQSKTIQFPQNLRQEDQRYVVDELVLSQSGEFYRARGRIRPFIASA